MKSIKTAFITSLSLISFTAVAGDLYLDGSEVADLVLYGDCEELKREIQSLEKVSNKKGLISKYPDEENWCQTNLHQLLPKEIAKMHMKKFNFPGPNCFATAMLGAKEISSMRGVDVEEFDSYIKRNCTLVEKPKYGDIGVFRTPNGDLIHGFFRISENLVLEKTGVDYVGKTPVQIRHINHTTYTFEASPECRRYGGGNKDCYNKQLYYHCEAMPAELPEDLAEIELKIESSFSKLLETELSVSEVEDLKKELTKLVPLYKDKLNALPKTFLDRDYLLDKSISYEKQLMFIR
jgi:hypothetical protein